MHEPNNFGDSLIYQQNIKNAIAGNISSYFEEGTLIKVSMRTGSPVYDTDGALLGVLSSGVRFDSDSELAELKELLNSEITIYLNGERITTTISRNGHSIVGTGLDPKIAEIVLESKQEYSGDADIQGEKYKAFYKPLLNAENKAFAAIVTCMPLAEIKMASDDFIRDGVFIGLIGLVVSNILLFFIVSSISKPLISLSADIDNFANGNLDVKISTVSKDEVGQLAKSLQKSVGTIHRLFDDIKHMLAEHEKGNTDYYLDANSFDGDYKLLANSISELAGSGMRDQLTKIANRRSFDNRLTLEWNRAKRVGIPISILMLDLDNFKNYNDAFGHQQGDTALITMTKVLMQSLKRPSDFAARWGGEEFVVLLSNTDSNGAFLVAEYIRKNIENMMIPCSDQKAEKITVSIGVNTETPDQAGSINNFIYKADIALYKAKTMGKNKVRCYEQQDFDQKK